MTKILSVSLTDEQSEFLNSKKISPSGIFQEKIIEIMKRFEEFAKGEGKVESIQKELGLHTEYLDQIGKFDEFYKWRQENVVQKEK